MSSETIEFVGTFLSSLIVIFTFPFSLFYCFRVVQEYERAVIFRMGRILEGGVKGPGIFFILPCIDNYQKVDLRTVSFSVPPQEILTKDSVTVSVDAVVYYRIHDPLKAVIEVEDYSMSTKLLAATTLRNVMGTKNLAQLLSERELVSHLMQGILDDATVPWGVKVERVEIKDVSLPNQLQKAMATEAEAAREARAKVIAAEGEMQASRALKNASDVMSSSPMALQLRYLQTLTNLANERSSTIIFPIPIDIMKPFISTNQTQTLEQPLMQMHPQPGNEYPHGRVTPKDKRVSSPRNMHPGELHDIIHKQVWDFGPNSVNP